MCSLLSVGWAHGRVGREQELLGGGAARLTVTYDTLRQTFVALAQLQGRPAFASCCIVPLVRWIRHQRGLQRWSSVADVRA